MVTLEYLLSLSQRVYLFALVCQGDKHYFSGGEISHFYLWLDFLWLDQYTVNIVFLTYVPIYLRDLHIFCLIFGRTALTSKYLFYQHIFSFELAWSIITWVNLFPNRRSEV